MKSRYQRENGEKCIIGRYNVGKFEEVEILEKKT